MPAAECPMCHTDFEREDCHSGCPISAACSMIRCPRCGHEFVDEGIISRFIASLFRGGTHDSLGNG